MHVQIRRGIPETSSSSASALSMISSSGRREHVRLDKTWPLVSGHFITDGDGLPHIYINRWQEKMSLLAGDTPLWHRMFRKATGQDFEMYRLYEPDFRATKAPPPSELRLHRDDNGSLWCTDYGYMCAANTYIPSEPRYVALHPLSAELLREYELVLCDSSVQAIPDIDMLPALPGEEEPDELLLEELIFNPAFAIDIGGDAFIDDTGAASIPFSGHNINQSSKLLLSGKDIPPEIAPNDQFRHAAYSLFEDVYQNGNETLILGGDGSKIRLCRDETPAPEYPDSIDLKITDCCCVGCPFCYEGCTEDGQNGEIPKKLFRQIPPFTELAIGGGDALLHPQVFDLPVKRRQHMNLTLHSSSFQYICMNGDRDWGIKQLKKFGAVGVSVTTPDEALSLSEYLRPLLGGEDGYCDSDWSFSSTLVKTYYDISTPDNYIQPVIHVINGIASPKILEPLYDMGLRLLVLGYKTKGRGADFARGESVAGNQRWLYDNIDEVAKHFSVTAFDTLALEQLEIRRFFTDDDWRHFYMGDDGQHSMYIDLVKREYGISSTDSRRFPLTDDLRGMFRHVRELSANDRRSG